MEHDSSNTLIQVICLLTAIATISWAIMVRPMRTAPRASLRFSLANFCVFIGMLLYTQRDHSASYLFWLGADVIILTGFAVLRAGAQTLYHLKSSAAIDATVIVIAALLMLLVPPQAAYAAYLVSILSICAAYCFYGLARDHYFAFKDTLTGFATYWLVVPIVIITVLFLLRAAILIAYPQQVDSFATLNTADSKPVLWVYIIFVLVVNILIIGNTINKLVTKIMTTANIDALTGVWNRNYQQQKLTKIHGHWLQTGQIYSVILFDIDHFKAINDSYGHAMGDEVLKKTSQELVKEIHHDDIFCRFGGEEFLVILPNTSTEDALTVANRCQQVLNDFSVITPQDKIQVTASFGVATIEPEQSIDQLLAAADKAMYQAKAAGRNCIKRAA